MSCRDLDPDSDGDFGVLDGKTALGARRREESLESRGASDVRVPLNTSIDGDTDEETDAGSSEGNLEWRIQVLEGKIEKNNKTNYKFTKAMNEYVVVRDEQIRTQRVEI